MGLEKLYKNQVTRILKSYLNAIKASASLKSSNKTTPTVGLNLA